MFRSTGARLALGAVILVALLGVLRYKPWQRGAQTASTATTEQARERLNVGFLPVT
jgi:ferric-dicitrate binding protein FerR (iron transport regulator)